jgi:hypothetical protein
LQNPRTAVACQNRVSFFRFVVPAEDDERGVRNGQGRVVLRWHILRRLGTVRLLGIEVNAQIQDPSRDLGTYVDDFFRLEGSRGTNV